MIETTASKSFGLEKRRQRVVRSPFVWLNLLCLDAPLVAIAWELLFARSFGFPIAPGGTAALFFTAWLIYLADRFGDSFTVDLRGPSSLRQRFCRRHQQAWLAGLIAVAIADLAVISTALERRSILVGSGLGLLAVIYLLLNQAIPSTWRRLPLKETSIGFLFAAGTIVPLGQSLTSAVSPAWILFAGLCSLNCVNIAIWERELDAAQKRISLATVFPTLGRYLLPVLIFFSLTSLVAIIFTSRGKIVYLCVAVSAMLLAAIHFWRNDINADVRTALADLVLLSPIAALVL
jgi:hypothetical protein